MTRTSQEQLRNKFSLVYEYNRQSPLFVRVAEDEIDKNNFHSAVEILSHGIESYPDYPTAYIMLGKVYIRLGEYEKAEDAFVKGSQLINSKRTLSYYINELEKSKRVDLLYLASKRIPFIPENFERIITEDEEDLQEAVEITDDEILMDIGTDTHPEASETTQEHSVPEEESPQEPDKPRPLEARLEDLAKELSNSKFFIKENETPADYNLNPQKEEEIVTETLAKILLSQGQFREAINVYKKLAERQPDKQTYYNEKITEIESQLDGW